MRIRAIVKPSRQWSSGLFGLISWSGLGFCLSAYFGWWAVLIMALVGLLLYPRKMEGHR